MKQINGIVLPEDFVDMNDVETGYVDGKGPGGVANKATCELVGKPIVLQLPGTFSDTVVNIGIYDVNNGIRYEQHSKEVTSLNTNGKVAIAATAIAATAGITCAILGACGVFDKD